MDRFRLLIPLFVLLAVLLVTAACGGGSGDDTPAEGTEEKATEIKGPGAGSGQQVRRGRAGQACGQAPGQADRAANLPHRDPHERRARAGDRRARAQRRRRRLHHAARRHRRDLRPGDRGLDRDGPAALGARGAPGGAPTGRQGARHRRRRPGLLSSFDNPVRPGLRDLDPGLRHEQRPVLAHRHGASGRARTGSRRQGRLLPGHDRVIRPGVGRVERRGQHVGQEGLAQGDPA